MAEDSGTFEQWITDRIDFSTMHPASGDSGDMEQWITDRVDLQDYVSAAKVRIPRYGFTNFQIPGIV